MPKPAHKYLFLLSVPIKGSSHEEFEGAKCVCSPPMWHNPGDMEAIRQGVANEAFTTFSTDYAPRMYDLPGGEKLGILANEKKNELQAHPPTAFLA